uniref:WH2 domain-containing protein n=1 Tax=Caenorhabditis tropicalis TaxID=1561998 RepID=A0A1I7SXG1_9PELO
MKNKSEKRLFGLFKKKTTPAPLAPPPPESVEETNRSATTIPLEEETTSSTDSITSTPLGDDMPPRKGSFAQTSVIHYSPPGTVRASFPPSATSSVVSDGSDDNGVVVITRKSNIVLDDEESVISTPVSQYDESPIVHKSRTKRTAPPPPPPTAPTSTVYPIPSPSSNQSSSSIPSPAPKQDQLHFRQESTISMNSNVTPPPPPPHKKQENEIDYEAMLTKLKTKMDEWNLVRLETGGGSMKEEKIKAEVLKEHEKLKLLLEKQITTDRPKTSSPSSYNSNNNYKSINNNNNVKPKSPVKMPQYGNFYAQPPTSPPPSKRIGAVPGGTVYQKTAAKEKSSSSPSSSSYSSVPVSNGNPVSPKTDENRNEVIPKKKSSATVTQNTEAVDRLRREVEEQRQREKEVKQYRNPKSLEIQVKSPEQKRKEIISPRPESPQKSSSGPRMIEYKPMKSPGIPVDPEDIYEEIGDVAPPIPNTPPPKLSEYRKEQNGVAPRMPSVPTNGYVRLQMNGAAKKQAPLAPGITQNPQKIIQTAYTGPEYASSPKLLRKAPEPSKSTKIYSTVPVKEEKKVYQKAQIHPQMTNGVGEESKEPIQNQIGMIKATSSSSNNYQKQRVNSPMKRGISVDQNGNGYSTKVSIPGNSSLVIVNSNESQGSSKAADYRKIQPNQMMRTTSEDQNNGYASKTTINIATSPYTQRKSNPTSSSNYRKPQISPMARAMSTDQNMTSPVISSPSANRKISAPVTTVIPPVVSLRSSSTDATSSPIANRRSQGSFGILSATSSKGNITSATSPPYPKGTIAPTVIPVKTNIPNARTPLKTSSSEGSFDISDVLKGPKLRKVGMPVERSGISLGKVVDAEPTNRPTSTPPPPPPPPLQGVISSPVLQQLAPKNPDLRDSLMNEIREAGRLRAARTAQSA